MLFWITALILAALVAMLIFLVIMREEQKDLSSEVDIYRDQLAEVDRDVARGTLPEAEAERARIEISRRILQADQNSEQADQTKVPPRWANLSAAFLAVLLLMGGAGVLYYKLGAPGHGDLPLKARIAMADQARKERPSQMDVEERLPPPILPQVDPAYAELLEKLRAVVSERPDDIQGLTLLARNEAGVGNMSAAYKAQRLLIDAKDEEATAEDFSTLAHFLVLAAGGYVSPEAENALAEALRRDRTDPPARYYSGLLFAQTGRPDLAFRFWATLLSESPPDSPWIPPIRAQIEDIAFLAGQHNFTLPPLPEANGPSAADVEAAEEMDPAERQAMIRNMVAGLAERLATEGGTASDWARLIRAYGVLGETETARPIWEEARQSFSNDEEALREIEAAARSAGLVE